MGVPSLYRWLTLRYPEIKKKIQKVSHIPVDNLYLDFNAIIHPCCNKELNTMDETDRQLYRNISNYLDMVMDRVRPRKLLYISIDGVAPRAKLNQQRSRRFVSAKESSEAGKEYFRDTCGEIPFQLRNGQNTREDSLVEDIIDEMQQQQVFDSNSITPGTEFMVRIDCFMNDFISYKISTDPHWNNLTVIFSGYKVPGEGEQKILEYIRNHQNAELTNVIYSPDADLIFLGLTLQDHKLYVMREEFQPGRADITSPSGNPYVNREIVFIDINRLRYLLISQFRQSIPFNFNYRRFIEDWVFMCFAVGNDFLPCLPCFEIRSNAIDKITGLLVSLFKKSRRHITNNGDIDLNALREFFVECSEREDDFLIEKKSNLLSVRKRMNLPLKEEEEFDLNSDAGKVRFYMEKMEIFSEKELIQACKEYIKGMVWVYRYYFYRIASWDWYYPYHFAPFIKDLACVDQVDTAFSLGRPLRPMEQLLAVLPPMSRALLPETLHDFFEKNEEFYPTEFKIDSFQKCMDWQAVPILPFIDMKRIVAGYNERQSRLTYKETERNIIGYSLLYSKNPMLLKKGASLYDNARPYEVISMEEFKGRIYAVPTARHVGETVDSCGFKYVNAALCVSFDQRKANTPNSKRTR